MQAQATSAAVFLLQSYQRWISPLLPPACRYVPTCSDYALEAVERYGVMRGSWKALGRLLRCHPLARGGHDPVVRGAARPSEPGRLLTDSEAQV